MEKDGIMLTRNLPRRPKRCWTAADAVRVALFVAGCLIALGIVASLPSLFVYGLPDGQDGYPRLLVILFGFALIVCQWLHWRGR